MSYKSSISASINTYWNRVNRRLYSKNNDFNQIKNSFNMLFDKMSKTTLPGEKKKIIAGYFLTLSQIAEVLAATIDVSKKLSATDLEYIRKILAILISFYQEALFTEEKEFSNKLLFVYDLLIFNHRKEIFQTYKSLYLILRRIDKDYYNLYKRDSLCLFYMHFLIL